MVSKELRGEARVAELLLHDRPRRVPEPMRVQLRDPMGTPSRAHTSLGAPNGQAFSAPPTVVAGEEWRGVVISCGEVALNLVPSMPGDHRGALDIPFAAHDHPLGAPIRAIQLERLGDLAASGDEEHDQGAIAELPLIDFCARLGGHPLIRCRR